MKVSAYSWCSRSTHRGAKLIEDRNRDYSNHAARFGLTEVCEVPHCLAQSFCGRHRLMGDFLTFGKKVLTVSFRESSFPPSYPAELQSGSLQKLSARLQGADGLPLSNP